MRRAVALPIVAVSIGAGALAGIVIGAADRSPSRW